MYNVNFLKNVKGKIQACKIAIDFTKKGNEKQFNALFGFSSKNHGVSTTYNALVLMIMIFKGSQSTSFVGYTYFN